MTSRIRFLLNRSRTLSRTFGATDPATLAARARLHAAIGNAFDAGVPVARARELGAAGYQNRSMRRHRCSAGSQIS